MMKRTHLSIMIALVFSATSTMAFAQTSADQTASQTTTPATTPQTGQRANVSSTSKVTAVATKRVRDLQGVQVTATATSLGGGLMSEQDAPKAVSTITRAAILEGAPGGTFVQAIESIPGVSTSTDDVTGLNDGDYSIRGFTSDEVGTTVNGAPINDSGSYQVYSTEYGDTENMGDITVQQGWPDVDQPISGAAGGSIGWVTVDPSHKAGVDVSQTFGSNSYHRTFFRLNTGDTGPVRSWLSYSNNEANLWRGEGRMRVNKVDAKSIWTINDRNSVSFSLQYNREVKNSYLKLTKAQAAQNYDQGYIDTWSVPGNTSSCDAAVTNNACNYQLHVNPFKSWLISADGEFTLSDSMHLSVVPYFQYGSGGGSGSTVGYETTDAVDNQYLNVNSDLNGNGVISSKDKALLYSLNQSFTYRPGIIAKLSQDFGSNDTLVYGAWWERPRQQQSEVFSSVNPLTGQPADIRATVDPITYPDGTVQKAYNEYTTTTTEKAFATNTWTPNEQWTVTAGLAYIWAERQGFDFNDPGSYVSGCDTSKYYKYKCQFGGPFDGRYHKWSPTAGVKFQLNDANQFYFGAGKSFRTPVNGALAQNGAADDLNQTHPYPGHSFSAVNKPETATSADLGWRFYAPRVSASIDVYAANFHNKQVKGYDQNSGQTVFTELPNVHMRGLNAEGSLKLSHQFTLYGSYTYTQSRQQDDTDTGGDGIYWTKGKTLTNTPLNSGYVSFRFHQGPMWASLNAKYRGAVWGDWSNTEKVGGYTTFNLSAGYHFHDFGSGFRKPYIKFNVFNLTDHKAFSWASSIPFLASTAPKANDVNGIPLYQGDANYSVLQSRAFMVTFGASFF